MESSALTLPYVEARHYLRASRKRVDLIVLHSMESPEKGSSAESCARYFATLPETGPKKASAHYCVDSDSIVQCVRDEHVAYHAPGCNHNAIGIEHAGYARQTRDEWLDDYGVAMLRRSAQLATRLCLRWSIPAVIVLPAGLQAGARGITTHASVSAAFGRSSHWDPGPGFPLDTYVAWVADALDAQARV